MKKLEDKVNLTRLDYFIYYNQLKEEREQDSRLLDENKIYLNQLGTALQEKNYRIKQVERDYDELSKLLALRERDLDKIIKQVSKINKQLEKAQKQVNKQQLTINKLNIQLGNKNDEIRVLNDRLNYSLSHRRAPDIEEIKAYEMNKKEVLKKIRGKKNATK